MADASVRENRAGHLDRLVEATPARRSDDNKTGAIEQVLIDKRFGRVGYASPSFGGFLPIG